MSNHEYAPIALFVYKRIEHTIKTIEALQKNKLAIESRLFIFSDGFKDNSDKECVNTVRNYIRNINGFKSIDIIERSGNIGLSENITQGVNSILSKYESIIVLEDDIVASVGFLKYMNDALIIYKNNKNVGCIHAWNYNLSDKNISHQTFFLKGGDCWGWATWKDAWLLFNKNGDELLKSIKSNNLEFEFNRKGTHQYISMLEDQTKGINNSWAVRWHASLFLNNKYCLHPVRPIVINIGLDNSGTHCGNQNIQQFPVEFIDVTSHEVEDSAWFYIEFAKYIERNKLNNKWVLLKERLKNLFHQS